MCLDRMFLDIGLRGLKHISVQLSNIFFIGLLIKPLEMALDNYVRYNYVYKALLPWDIS